MHTNAIKPKKQLCNLTSVHFSCHQDLLTHSFNKHTHPSLNLELVNLPKVLQKSCKNLLLTIYVKPEIKINPAQSSVIFRLMPEKNQ